MLKLMKIRNKNPLLKFLAYVVKPADPSACRDWVNTVEHRNYPKFYVGTPPNRKMFRAHRFSFERHNGPIPEGLQVLHSCDNPRCTNPRHLFLGTNEVNMKDRNAKNRLAFGERTGSAKLTWKLSEEIKDLYATGNFSQRELGKRYGVAHTAIGSITRGEHWVSRS